MTNFIASKIKVANASYLFLAFCFSLSLWSLALYVWNNKDDAFILIVSLKKSLRRWYKLSKELDRSMTDAWQNVHALGMMSPCIDYYFPLTPAISYIFNAIPLKQWKHVFSLSVLFIRYNIKVNFHNLLNALYIKMLIQDWWGQYFYESWIFWSLNTKGCG